MSTTNINLPQFKTLSQMPIGCTAKRNHLKFLALDLPLSLYFIRNKILKLKDYPEYFGSTIMKAWNALQDGSF